MEEKIFEEFFEWVKDLVEEDVCGSEEYKQKLRAMGAASEKISQKLGSSKMIDEYSNAKMEEEVFLQYHLCKKLLEVFAL